MFHGIFNKTANNLNTNNFNISTDYRVIQSISLYNIVYTYRWIYEYDYGSNFLLHLYMYVGISSDLWNIMPNFIFQFQCIRLSWSHISWFDMSVKNFIQLTVIESIIMKVSYVNVRQI